jgi:hypothetical protein
MLPKPKICKDCKYFIGDKLHCRKFGDTDLITGKVSYDTARSVRNNETKCGEKASHFEKNNFKFVTEPYYYVKENLIFLTTGTLLGLYVYLALSNIKHF